MAIVFISPKQRQKVILYIITGATSLGLIIFGILIFTSKPGETPVEQVFKAPKIEIDFEILNFEKVKNLELFEGIKKEFNYQGRTKEKGLQSGKILALSQEEAVKSLEALGFFEIKIEESLPGRENPFFIKKTTPRLKK